jgi:hypothetical protein
MFIHVHICIYIYIYMSKYVFVCIYSLRFTHILCMHIYVYILYDLFGDKPLDAKLAPLIHRMDSLQNMYMCKYIFINECVYVYVNIHPYIY